MLLFATGITSISASPDPWRVTGPEECAECHDVEYGIWEETPHSLTYESMPDSDEGFEIGEKMGLDSCDQGLITRFQPSWRKICRDEYQKLESCCYLQPVLAQFQHHPIHGG